MGKKRKASSGASQPKGSRDYDPKDARLGPISTYEDVADSEDEHFLNQEQIMFDQAPKSKKQKRLEEQEELLEDSDEEILDYGEDLDSEEDELEVLAKKAKKFAPKKKKGADAGSEHGDDEEEDSGWWGSSRKDYYNADEIQTEADALEEEQEARRLQKKKLAKMTEEDFIEAFNEDEWLGDQAEDAEDDDVVTEVLKDVEISDDMSLEERTRLLHSRYPELDYLAGELLELQPLLVSLQKDAEGQNRNSAVVVKYRILGCYVATLAMYFATLTSPARDSDDLGKALDPAQLRDHEVMGTLLECREAWQQVKDLKTSKPLKSAAAIPSPPDEDEALVEDALDAVLKPSKKAVENGLGKKAKKAERRAKELEESLADLDALAITSKRPRKVAKIAAGVDNDSDFGEEETLDSRTAAEKAARKKSLRFYTSQIVQKANKRAGAGRDAGGDMDIPYRERLRDRQARLNREAEKRGKNSAAGAELGDESDDDDRKAANELRDGEDEYYDMVAAKSSNKKAQKAARAEALAAASKADRVIEQEEIGEDGKRKITYAIEKNKGLAPKRSKDVRNPRVKQKKKYQAKQKKLGSMKAVFKGGEGKGGYGGELTGIKPGLIKSVKLS